MKCDDIEGRERIRPGLFYVMLGLCAFTFVLCLFYYKCVETFAGSGLLLPLSTNRVTLVPKSGRKEERAVVEPSPQWVPSSMAEQSLPSRTFKAMGWSELPGGQTNSLLAAWVVEGLLPSVRERRSCHRLPEARACCRLP